MPCPRCARWKAIPPPPGRRTARRPRNEDHFAATTLPPLAVQSFSVFISVVPWPLQPFWPLHALLALWHEPWPLHSFTPAHLTALLEAFFSFSLAWAAPDANSEPTAAAIGARDPPPGSGVRAVPGVEDAFARHDAQRARCVRALDNHRLRRPGLGEHVQRMLQIVVGEEQHQAACPRELARGARSGPGERLTRGAHR